ncbi:TIGR03086 family metal-binding protein [Pseudonocardia alaniniphila]|uniref:TIGR03086 family metal-binding protein n=2 Tax=Pseudonocardia alaniniphila TaxID=75291 RepID=A0ABS9T9I5_9PSEU|nr:TIGR03086 family metal-binding protein [Pseudonocardia alaniniphila]
MIDLLAGVADDQLGLPTPCTEYTVGNLIEHVDQVSHGFSTLGHQGTGSEAAVTQFGPGWRDTVAQHVQELGKAWDDPMAWQGSTNLSGLELTNELWGKIALTELVVHGWDIAKATGQPFDLPEPTLRACLDHVAVFVPKAPIPALWDSPVDVEPGATLIERIVAITGRTP